MLGGNSRNIAHKHRVFVGTTALCAAVTVLGLTAVPASADDVPDFRPEQWGPESIGATEMWEETQGQGTVVALPGASVEEGHPDLRDNLEVNTDFGDNDGDVDEGTAMAALAGAHGHGMDADGGVLGIAPSAGLLALPTDDEMDEAVRQAGNEGVQVILLPEYDPDLSDAAADAAQNGTVVVAPAGDEEDPNVVSVAGTDENGDLIDDAPDDGEVVDLTAPGDDLATAEPDLGEARVSGPAYAAAVTAGAVALLRAEYPQLQPEQVREVLVAGSQEGPAGLPALNVPGASTQAATVAQDSPILDDDLAAQADDSPTVPVWVWFAAVGAVLLFGFLALVVWIRRSTADPYGVEAEREEEEARIAAERGPEAEAEAAADSAARNRQRGGRRRKPRRGRAS